ncbi:MAG: SRPBCC family protein [Armatimonadota bacterium]
MRALTYEDTWTIAAPVQAVWRLIEDFEGYPRWWEIYDFARWKTPGRGVGATGELKARRFGYDLVVVLEVTHIEEFRVSEVRLSGDLEGVARWTLEPDGERATRVAYYTSAAPTKMLLPIPDFLAKPMLDLIHKGATRKCIRGMRAELEEVR